MECEGWKFQSHPLPPGRGERLETDQSLEIGQLPMASDFINHAYIMKLCKNKVDRNQKSWSSEHVEWERQKATAGLTEDRA